MQNSKQKSSPSESEIRKLWEWCGLHYESYNSPGFPHQGGAWHNPDGYALGCELPPIDLNTLFKYAVPKLKKLGIMHVEFVFDLLQPQVLVRVHEIPYVSDADPALALFWAIWDIICPH